MASIFSAITASVNNTVTNLQAVPKKVKCSNEVCGKELDVPPNIFDWVCVKCRKINERTVSVCVACQASRLEVVTPTVQCTACGTSTIVPTSNASKALKATGAAAKKLAQTTAQKTKETYEMLKSAPTQFNCEHCNALLGVPPGLPWRCIRAECGFTNQDGYSDTCMQCKFTRQLPEMKVECGVCHKVTKVPTTNFVNKVKSGVQDLDRSVKKIYYDISGTDYVTCPRCAAPIKIPTTGGAEKKAQDTAGPVPETSTEVTCIKCQEKLILVKK